MDIYEDVTKQEEQYLKNTISFIENRLIIERESSSQKKESIIEFRRNMYANSTNDPQDMGKLAEAAQYLTPLTIHTTDYHALEQKINLFEKMVKAPYFARIDFTTESWGSEIVYIGIGNVENEDTFDVYVYDWRAPIASVFYRYELGHASYQAPTGLIEGEVNLKRQYEIEDGALKYFFDSGVNIVDDILKEALSKNTSPQMQAIVETIQREQDMVIRDIDNDLVIVQGVAGSGKTSIALHRAAYLMYQGLGNKLSARNMILISPNRLFEQYVSQVLPELGESHIRTLTFEEIFEETFGEQYISNSRNQTIEEILSENNSIKQDSLHHHYTYKTTGEFLEILNWLMSYYLHRVVVIPDIMFGGKIIAKGNLLKERVLLSSTKKLTPQARLQQIEIYIANRLEELRPAQVKHIEKLIGSKKEHSFDYKDIARRAVSYEIKQIMKNLKKSTHIQYFDIYHKLFFDSIVRNAAIAKFPKFEEFVKNTKSSLSRENIPYVDAIALLYLRSKMGSIRIFDEIRQVVVDEVQDYSPIHFEILNSLFPMAKYTVLGDVNQTLLDTEQGSLYDNIRTILNKKKNTLINLTKSFRCSHEISTFASRFADNDIFIEQLERHDQPVLLIHKPTTKTLCAALVIQLKKWRNEGYGTIAVICKTMEKSKELYESLKDSLPVGIMEEGRRVDISNTIILPVYLAKGLEFDCVAIYGTDSEAYTSEDDRRLLYISTTRALHRLGLYYTGTPSSLL